MKTQNLFVSKSLLFGIFVVLIINSISVKALAAERSIHVIQKHKNSYIQQEVVLQNLKDSDLAESPYFKVVLGTSDDPIRFSAVSKETQLRAGTVLYHLEKSRSFFLPFTSELRNDLNSPLIVRIEITTPYSPALHFKQKFQESERIYNNTFSFSGWTQDFPPENNVNPWGPEIWFFSPKKEKKHQGNAIAGAQLLGPSTSNTMTEQLIVGDVAQISQDLFLAPLPLFPIEEHLASVLFSIGLGQTLPRIMGSFLFFKKDSIRMDLALIPEVISHEYCHHAFSKLYRIDAKTHVAEGFPNFFGSYIQGTRKMGDGGRRFARGQRLSSKHKRTYNFNEESSRAIHGDFLYSVLYDISDALGKDGIPVILLALSRMNATSNLRLDFTREILRATRELASTSGGYDRVSRIITSRF